MIVDQKLINSHDFFELWLNTRFNLVCIYTCKLKIGECLLIVSIFVALKWLTSFLIGSIVLQYLFNEWVRDLYVCQWKELAWGQEHVPLATGASKGHATT